MIRPIIRGKCKARDLSRLVSAALPPDPVYYVSDWGDEYSELQTHAQLDTILARNPVRRLAAVAMPEPTDYGLN